MAPAYRLHTALPGGRSARTSVGLGVDSSRPKLVLLRPTDDAAAADVDGDDGAPLRAGGRARPARARVPARSQRATCRPSAASRRDGAAPCCCAASRGVAISTALIGVFPGMHLAWVFTGLSGLAALGLVGLMAYAKELEAEQAAPPLAARCALDRGGRPIAASAGYPGRLGRRRLRGAAGRRPLTSAVARRSSRAGELPFGRLEARLFWVAAGGVAQLAERYVRNVEAVGSNPITSTKESPGQRTEGGSPP